MLFPPLRSELKPVAKHTKLKAKSRDDDVSGINSIRSFENQEYLIRERQYLLVAGVQPDHSRENSRSQFWDREGNQWIWFCYDAGCTGAVIPKELVESDSGPMEPLTEGAR